MCAKSLQSCLILCNPMDGSSPGSSLHGILQARTLEWVAISFSIVWKWKVKVKSESEVAQSCPTLLDPMDCSPPASSSVGFSRQEYWSGLPLPSPGKLPQERTISDNDNFSVSVQFSSVTQSYLTLCDPMNCSTWGLPVHHQLLESTQTHVQWVGDAIQPSHPLMSPSAQSFPSSAYF